MKPTFPRRDGLAFASVVQIIVQEVLDEALSDTRLSSDR
jgi:hypothetical protein